MIFELKIFFQRPVSTPIGLVMFSKEKVEAPTRTDAQRILRAKWESLTSFGSNTQARGMALMFAAPLIAVATVLAARRAEA